MHYSTSERGKAVAICTTAGTKKNPGVITHRDCIFKIVNVLFTI